MMHCWKCRKQLDDSPLPFRATCDHCSAWLHCCVNCHYYQPGLPNDCKIPGTEQIADREACNFCDEFFLKKANDPPPTSIEDVSKKLFGEETESDTKNFNDLFND